MTTWLSIISLVGFISLITYTYWKKLHNTQQQIQHQIASSVYETEKLNVAMKEENADLRLMLTQIYEMYESKIYQDIYNKHWRLVVLVGQIQKTRYKNMIKDVNVVKEEVSGIPIAIEITSKNDYSYIITQNENDFIVNADYNNRKSAKVFSPSKSKELLSLISDM